MVETQVILSHPVLFGMQSSLSSIGLWIQPFTKVDLAQLGQPSVPLSIFHGRQVLKDMPEQQ